MATRIAAPATPSQFDWTKRLDLEIAAETAAQIAAPVSRPRHRHSLRNRVGHLRVCSAARSFDLFAALDE